MFSSTWATATIGGFIAGGSGGVGSCTWGSLRDLGNIIRLRVVTMEAEPRVLELTGDDIQKANHAMGNAPNPRRSDAGTDPLGRGASPRDATRLRRRSARRASVVARVIGVLDGERGGPPTILPVSISCGGAHCLAFSTTAEKYFDPPAGLSAMCLAPG